MRIVGDEDTAPYEIAEPGDYLIWPWFTLKHFIGYSMYLLDYEGDVCPRINEGVEFLDPASALHGNSPYLDNPSPASR